VTGCVRQLHCPNLSSLLSDPVKHRRVALPSVGVIENQGRVADMISTTALDPDFESAARALYDAEVALHAAHQTQVDEWIRVAADRLHDAVLRYEACVSAPVLAAAA
jgi:hypothetical protein